MPVVIYWHPPLFNLPANNIHQYSYSSRANQERLTRQAVDITQCEGKVCNVLILSSFQRIQLRVGRSRQRAIRQSSDSVVISKECQQIILPKKPANSYVASSLRSMFPKPCLISWRWVLISSRGALGSSKIWAPALKAGIFCIFAMFLARDPWDWEMLTIYRCLRPSAQSQEALLLEPLDRVPLRIKGIGAKRRWLTTTEYWFV